MATKISQKDYLKKYLSSDITSEKKKKKKKPKLPIKQSIQIIDDDLDVGTLKKVTDEELELYAMGEDAPQIVGVIDDRPPELIAVEDYEKSIKWKRLGSDSDIIPNKTEQNLQNIKFDGRLTKKSSRMDDFPSDKIKREKTTPDLSPIRQQNNSNSNDRRRYSSDISPQRHNQNLSPIRRKVQSRSPDLSPVRRRNKSRSSDLSPVRRRNKSRSPDLSPIRKRNKTDNEAHSNRRRNRSISRDLSPVRKQIKSEKRDESPRQQNRSAIRDQSPKRRRNRSVSQDQSPKRLWDKSRSKERSPVKRRNRSRSRDQSPIRRKNRSRSRDQRNQNYSPVRRRNRTRSPKRRNRSPRKCTDSDESPPRRENIKSEKRSQSPEGLQKIKKTLDGKTAGLQDAKALRAESDQFRKREDELFKKMSKEVSGQSSDVVVRDRHTGRKRDLVMESEREREKMEKEEERQRLYTRWGKGLKQIEDYKARVESDIHEYSKPLARYADDQDLENMLKKQERAGDPMLEYIRSKEKTRKDAEPSKPIYQGSYPENRFSIRPGYRWDGVDRSNGYEKKYFEEQSRKKAIEEEAYKYSTEDM